MIGPLINDKQAAKVAEQLNDAVAKGAKVVLGGGVNGRYIEPTILVDVTPEMKIYQEETFGPVVPVFPFKNDDEAIAMAERARDTALASRRADYAKLVPAFGLAIQQYRTAKESGLSAASAIQPPGNGGEADADDPDSDVAPADAGATADSE